MSKELGLWIHNRETVIVDVADKGDEPGQTESVAEMSARLTGSSEVNDASISADIHGNRNTVFIDHLNAYNQAVAACIHDPYAILLFGPLVAKNEVQHQPPGSHSQAPALGIKAFDRMNEMQGKTRVSQHTNSERQQ